MHEARIRMPWRAHLYNHRVQHSGLTLGDVDLGKIDVEFKVDGYGGDNKEWTNSIPLMLASNNRVFFNRPINRRMMLMILCMGCG